MCTGIAISTSELPNDLACHEQVAHRRYTREAGEEFQFHWWHTPAILPVRWDGRLRLLPWGSKSRHGRLPFGGWVSDEIAHEIFAHPEPVVIPANLGFQRGTWFLILEGIRGLVIETGTGPVVYMRMMKATNYYRNMTEQSPTMPLFVNQVI
jgi:hypothetical protein